MAADTPAETFKRALAHAARALAEQAELEVVFKSREAAEWELFRRRWRQHTGEMINEQYEDKPA